MARGIHIPLEVEHTLQNMEHKMHASGAYAEHIDVGYNAHYMAYYVEITGRHRVTRERFGIRTNIVMEAFRGFDTERVRDMITAYFNNVIRHNGRYLSVIRISQIYKSYNFLSED